MGDYGEVRIVSCCHFGSEFDFYFFLLISHFLWNLNVMCYVFKVSHPRDMREQTQSYEI